MTESELAHIAKMSRPGMDSANLATHELLCRLLLAQREQIEELSKRIYQLEVEAEQRSTDQERFDR